MQEVHGVSGKPGDVLDHHHLEEALLSVGHHPQKLLAVFDFCAGDALVGVEADQVVPGALGVLGEEAFLGLQAVQLVLFVGGDTAVGGDVHGFHLSVRFVSFC